MSDLLTAIFGRRAIREFEPVEIPEAVRERILDAARVAPSSFNVQPYRFYWVETPAIKKNAARLCMGQAPAETATALIVAVADIGSWRMTMQSQADRRGGGHRVVANDHAKPVGMDGQRRIQRNPDFQVREESEPGEMVFH